MSERYVTEMSDEAQDAINAALNETRRLRDAYAVLEAERDEALNYRRIIEHERHVVVDLANSLAAQRDEARAENDMLHEDLSHARITARAQAFAECETIVMLRFFNERGFDEIIDAIHAAAALSARPDAETKT